MIKFKKNNIYHIEWLDHTTCYYSWTKGRDINTDDWLCSTAGFFIKESKTCLFFALNKSGNDDEYGNVMQILKSTVVKAKRLM